MAQCFVTTYQNHYRLYQNPERVQPIRSTVDDIYAKALPPQDIWFVPEAEEALDPDVVTKFVTEVRKRYYISTYQRHYCKDRSSGGSSENQLLESCREMYEKGVKPKIPAPLPKSRRMFGYIRPTRNYNPMSSYQFSIGKTGYEILKDGKRRKKAAEVAAAAAAAAEAKKDPKEVAADGRPAGDGLCCCCRR